MINDLLQYTMHIAPSLAVVIVLLMWQNKRIGVFEDRMQTMLNTCLQKLFEQLGAPDDPRE